jgi:protein phosphatase
MMRAWAATRTGRVRERNEDRCLVGSWRSGPADDEWAGEIAAARPWAFVADGMGGHGAGEMASEVAVESLNVLMASAGGPSDLGWIIEDANRQVFDAMHAPGGRPAMGTTVAGIWIEDRRVNVFNVGDSRIYVVAEAGIRRVSVDHTPARGLPDGRRSHALTQSLGGTSLRLPLQPHIEALSLESGQTVVICTDGLTDMLTDQFIGAILRTRPTHPAVSLAEAAVRAGGRDNVTVIVASF